VPHQCSLSRIRVPRDSWPNFIAWNLRFPEPAGPGSRGSPVKTPRTGFGFAVRIIDPSCSLDIEPVETTSSNCSVVASHSYRKGPRWKIDSQLLQCCDLQSCCLATGVCVQSHSLAVSGFTVLALSKCDSICIRMEGRVTRDQCDRQEAALIVGQSAALFKSSSPLLAAGTRLHGACHSAMWALLPVAVLCLISWLGRNEKFWSVPHSLSFEVATRKRSVLTYRTHEIW
jgi:hypothetical protein